MRALDAEGVMYARTHSKRRSVGREGESSGSSPELKSGSSKTTGGVRRSIGMRLYTGERSVVPPPPIRQDTRYKTSEVHNADSQKKNDRPTETTSGLPSAALNTLFFRIDMALRE